MSFNLSYIANKFIPTKLTEKETNLIKIRAQTVEPGQSVLLADVNDNAIYTSVRVSLRQSVEGSHKLYAQHLNDLSHDFGTSESKVRIGRMAYLTADKRSSWMKVYYHNLSEVAVIINADVLLSVELDKENTILDEKLNVDFYQKGSAESGASNVQIYADSKNVVSSTNPLPVIVHGQSTEVTFDGAITAEKYGEPNANVSLSAETDDNGQGVLRTIDSNPWAYDAVNDVKKIQYAPRTWTVTREVDNAVLNATKSAEPTKYYIIKGAYVSTSDGVTPTKWAIMNGDITMAQGYAVGAGLQLTAPIKITDGNSVTLRCWPNDIAGVKVAATLIGETFNVGD